MRSVKFGKPFRDGIMISPGHSGYFVAGPIDELGGSVHKACDTTGRYVTLLRRFGRIGQRGDVFIHQNTIHLGAPVILIVDESSTEPMQLGDAER